MKSKKLRNSARGENCTLRLGNCSSNETVVLCHIGKRSGMGMKCGDHFAVYACHNCHGIIDNRVKHCFSYDELNSEKLRALEETQEKMIQKGLVLIEL